MHYAMVALLAHKILRVPVDFSGRRGHPPPSQYFESHVYDDGDYMGIHTCSCNLCITLMVLVLTYHNLELIIISSAGNIKRSIS